MSNIKYEQFGERQNWVNGKYERSNSDRNISVLSPYFDQEISTVPDSNYEDLDHAVKVASSAFLEWSRLNIRDRSEIMFQFKRIIEANLNELANIIALDNGKTLDDAKASIMRGKEVVEFATSLPNVLKGDSSEVSNGITCTMTHEPLGVVAGITPFNFPAMVPLWMIPLAITTGNC